MRHVQRVNGKVNVTTVLWKLPTFTQWSVESVQQIIGMACVGFERLITQNIVADAARKDPALHNRLHGVVQSSIVTAAGLFHFRSWWASFAGFNEREN